MSGGAFGRFPPVFVLTVCLACGLVGCGTTTVTGPAGTVNGGVTQSPAGSTSPSQPLTTPIDASLLPPGMETGQQPGGFDVAEAKRLALLVNGCEDAGLRYRISVSGNAVDVAIRGTKTLADLVADIDIGSIPLGDPRDGVRVHRGFHERATDILRALQDRGDLARLKSSSAARLKVTGHSLGGAVAQIVGALAADQGVPVDRVAVFSFGAPPISDGVFSARFGALQIWRIEASGDTIPYVFNGPLVHYEHVGVRVGLHENGAYGVAEPFDYPILGKGLKDAATRILPGLPNHNFKFSYLHRMGFTVTLQI